MRTKRLILILLAELVCVIGYSQTWIRVFGNNMIADVTWVIETYDKGYLILDNSHDYLWLIKTDINGNKLWDKHIGTGIDFIRFGNVEQTMDGGFVLGGAFSKYSTGIYDPCIIKLDPCGQLQWCTDIHLPGRSDFATCVRQTPEGNYILLTMYSGPYIVSLYKFDSSGSLLWKQDYHPDTLVFDEEVFDVRVDNDGYLISGVCYFSEYPGGGGYERPYYIKADSSGSLSWWLAYGSGTGNGYHGFTIEPTQKSSSGNYYSFTTHSNYCDTPAFVKFLSNGQESYYHDLIPGLCPGTYWGSLDWINDSTLITHAHGKLAGDSVNRWLLMDTLGNTKDYKDYPAWMAATASTTRTFDNKFISVASVGDIWIYLYKLNSSLEYDSIYTHQYTYDSLCPGGVVSDTINPDCDLVVSIDEQIVESESSQMKVHPNPASEGLTIEFPKYLRLTDKKSGMRTSTVHYQWQSTILEIYDLFGKLMFSKEIPGHTKTLELNVSEWNEGLYLARLEFNKESLGLVKFIISR